MTITEEAQYELQLRKNVLYDLEARYFLAEVKRDKEALELKMSEARISIRKQEAAIARLERAARN
jgi:hypothetical protein